MKQFNGFESEKEQEFITTVVKEVTDNYPNVHTISVCNNNGTVKVTLNDVGVEFEGFDDMKALHQNQFLKPYYVGAVKITFQKRIREICDKEFK